MLSSSAPGFGYWLAPQDKALATIGIPSKLASPQGPIPMRTYDAVSLGNLLSSKGAQLLFKRFSVGTVRAATADERQVFYTTIPFEIDKVPISVVERGQQSLVMVL